ncbi:unnamed protein product, partial [Nesidiocoris tenuis]
MLFRRYYFFTSRLLDLHLGQSENQTNGSTRNRPQPRLRSRPGGSQPPWRVPCPSANPRRDRHGWTRPPTAQTTLEDSIFEFGGCGFGRSSEDCCF